MRRRTRTKEPPQTVNVCKLYLGIDNGVSGSVGWSGFCGGKHLYGQVKTPVFSQKNYTKAKGNITRIDHEAFRSLLMDLLGNWTIFAVVERPMVNPGRFKASVSALRALESTQILLEYFKIPYQFVDSKEWQKEMLPKDIKGPKELKAAGIEIANRIFPSIECKPDADGILMAEWARRMRL